jgi:hypothetical protein
MDTDEEIKLPINYQSIHWSERKAIREEYARIQGNLCYHCKEPLNGPPAVEITNMWIDKELFPKGFFDWPIHLHHDHNTDMTVGTVHCHCNAVLWQYHGE